MNASKPVLGLSWQGGAIGNAEWSGARLIDVLAFAGIDVDKPEIRHIQFEGADHGADGNPYGESDGLFSNRKSKFGEIL
jgi:sulfite oxidase